MDRPKNGSSGKQSPFFNNATPSTLPPTSSSSMYQGDRRHRGVPAPGLFPVSGFYGNPGITPEMHYPLNNGVYYSNPQTPTMRSPPPGFAPSSGVGPPGYQHYMMQQNVHHLQGNPALSGTCPQNLYQVGYVNQQSPMFNNNFVGCPPPPVEIGGRPNSFHSLTPNNQKHLHQEYLTRGVDSDNIYMDASRGHGLGGVEMVDNSGFGQRQDGNNGTNGIRSALGGESNSSATTLDKDKTGIKPLIDNIVGSMMFNGVNGAYTHFGPSGGIPGVFSGPGGSLSTEFDQNMHGEGQSQAQQIQFGMSPSSSPVLMQGSLGKNAQVSNNINSSGMSDMKINENRQESSPTNLMRSNHSAEAAAPAQISGRSSTPSDIQDNNNSRPQTPNKLSYSEILAKNSKTGNTTPYRKAAGAPNSTISKGSSKENLSGSKKKSDATALSSGSSANSSSCTSLSSSPVAKQKTLSQTIMGRLFTTQSFGKENAAVTPPKTSSYSRTPTTTPTHQRKVVTTEPKQHDDRKILSSQNSSGNIKVKPTATKFVKDSTVPGGGSVFSELNSGADDVQQEDGDWKTIESYSRNKYAAARHNSFQNSSSNKSPCEEASSSSGSNGSIFAKSSNGMDDEDESKNDDVGGAGAGVSRRESLNDSRKSGNSFATTSSTATGSSGSQSQRKSREKERPKSKKDGRNSGTFLRRCERIVYLWAATMISAMAWLVKLVTDVFSLSVSVGSTLLEDLYSWWLNKALPGFSQQFQMIEETVRVSVRKLRESCSWKMIPFLRRKVDDENTDLKKNSADLLAALGPEKNVPITNADETLKRLLSCKGQDPYSILGVRSDSSDEVVRRYYKKQAVLVHPDKNAVVGAEEAFKILGKAFELLGEPTKRQEYHSKLFEAHAKEQVYGEIGKLLEQLRKKMEIATSSIRCTKCNLRHKKNKTDRPLFAARYCAQCNIHHAAREGELWAEKRGWFGFSWNYFTCMDSHIWEINEWAKCQKKNLLHIKADSHCVMYRLVAGGGGGGDGSNNGGQQFPGGPEGQPVNPDDDWDSLINNLYKTGGVPGNKSGDHFYQQGGNSGGSGAGFYNGSGATGGAGGASSSNPANGAAAGRKRKGKRK